MLKERARTVAYWVWMADVLLTAAAFLLAWFFRSSLAPRLFPGLFPTELYPLSRYLGLLALIVPIWTMGSIEKDQLSPLLEAVQSGVGLAGVHGGTGDAFRQETEFQYMVGGQWVAHPGGDGVEYEVHIEDVPSPITAGL
ncbi:MAG: ThuA domain-containing protein, partial [Acidobacteriota bacterium]